MSCSETRGAVPASGRISCTPRKSGGKEGRSGPILYDFNNNSVSGQLGFSYTSTGCETGCSGLSQDKVASVTTPLGSIQYTYDKLGRRKTMTVTGQPAINYTYDANGHRTEIGTQINSNPATFSLWYDDAGRRMALALLNGTTSIYGYDDADRLLELQHLSPTSDVMESINYAYDQNGNRTAVNRAATALVMPGNSSDISYNQANRMQTFNADNIIYDDNGNMTSFTNSCGTTNYTWDVRNRLVGINGFTLTSTLTCSPVTAAFKYDAFGRRISKTINGTTTQYVYDGVDIVQEIQGTSITNYMRTLNVDEPLARIFGVGTVRYYHTDVLGSIIGLSDESGEMVTTYAYAPFGQVAISGEISDNPFQYTGRENDGTGLYYYRARYYSPELQRFISEDPIGFEGSDVNFYAYVSNDPVNEIDPDGLEPKGGERGRSGGLGGKNSNKPWKHCQEYDPPDPRFVKCRDQHGQWKRKPRPPEMPFPSPEKPKQMCGEECISKVATVVVTAAGTYVVYRCIRMLPSLLPPLWPTIPVNAALP